MLTQRDIRRDRQKLVVQIAWSHFTSLLVMTAVFKLSVTNCISDNKNIDTLCNLSLTRNPLIYFIKKQTTSHTHFYFEISSSHYVVEIKAATNDYFNYQLI